MSSPFSGAFDLKREKGVYLPEMSTWVLSLLVSPRGSQWWEKLNPAQGLAQPARQDPTFSPALSFLLKELVLGLPGQGPRWGHWDVFYTPGEERKWEIKCPPPGQASCPLRPVLAPQCEGHMFSSSLPALETSKYPQECVSHLGKAGGEASELQLGSGS